MRLVVGLGNIGKTYFATRHNIGFAVVEHLLQSHGLQLKSETKFEAKCLVTDLSVFSEAGDEKLIFALPSTYMNHSGRAVRKLLDFYKLASTEMLVVHDDVSIDLGTLRISLDRGAGGQHGVENIIQHLGGSRNFYRLRVGVGPDPGGELRGDYVLSRFRAEQEELVSRSIAKSSELILDWLLSKPLDGTIRLT